MYEKRIEIFRLPILLRLFKNTNRYMSDPQKAIFFLKGFDMCATFLEGPSNILTTTSLLRLALS